ncbi:hypothetical protein [Gracilibacillus salinarum]|uniref:Uncharacterized protein n=1 Tax=Gracilibacillus salinarum TaxID=2932255 RepID=A0ABY4GR09_9BACI|nr:hypothetical protein [Gracilibacillus salinarum]UOQ86580.1 hypothetical protein MUN87_06750 [Gracilibacillus salinarum]
MGRYISIFIFAMLMGVGCFFFIIPAIFRIYNFDIAVGMIVIVFGSMIITQLFFVIDKVKEIKR